MEAIQIAERIEKCGLNGVLRIFSIAKNPLGNTKESVPVRHDKTLKCCRVTSSGRRQRVASSLVMNEGPTVAASFSS
jgi:hypothetical protein